MDPHPPEYYAEDRGPKLIAISCAFAVVTTVVVLLQFYAKRYSAPRFDTYDFFLIGGYVLNLVACAMAIASTHLGGIGRHIESVERDTPWQVRGWAISIFAFEIGYFTSVAFPKIAIICLYLRIFNWTGPKRYFALALIFLNAALATSLAIVACFQCRPLAFWWDKSIEGGSCIDIQTFYHAQALPGLLLDLGVIALPLQSIWRMNLPFFRKVALGMIFVIGSFGIVAAIVRTTVFFSTEALDDRTMASVDLEGWSIIETSMYIVAVCMPRMPPLRPLVSEIVPNRLRVICRRTTARVSAVLSHGSKAMSTVSRRTARSFPWTSKRGPPSSSVVTSSAADDARTGSSSPPGGLAPPPPLLLLRDAAGREVPAESGEKKRWRDRLAQRHHQTWIDGEDHIEAEAVGGPYRRKSLPAIGSLEKVDSAHQQLQEREKDKEKESKEAAGQVGMQQQQLFTPRESGSSRLPRSPRSAIFVTCGEPSTSTSSGTSGFKDAEETISVSAESEPEVMSRPGTGGSGSSSIMEERSAT
ncbi:hypothetical protein MCOR27_010417 [Pyricularia oryzae]|uniref:Rhodopsin domain-containing protein n=1 Tax=Pyricularia grisea TaxID=148305 RepID=A0ABQ8NBR9_PYRGI|nr:hypothetical protein MCOR01_005655 [Pyricularia oryzae]KAI6294431.1 hypothetical protein MCOR33_008442 [Pyricularia grisea]KAI6251751.1 hypothetical protein MCOR19_011614 [Pyricularia oryzae]KAI6264121.1 hypothetical protein MCOR26_011569 [Pyricularia oryzae]KAI6267834.1 hypothetical protein MCOR27_010417 [Pyricularia oryzae]